ncbi:MAG: flagellar hook-associated protein FlgK [Acidobacteriota bacterium]
MVTLFDGMRNAVSALRATGEALAATQQNLTNAGTAGYARRNVSFTSDGFDPSRGLAGGVHATSETARNLYAEQAVSSQTSQKGFFDTFTQSANGVSQVLGLNDVSGSTGIQGALKNLFQSFSKLLQGGSDPVSQQKVVEKAREFATTISQTADFLQEGAAMAQSRIHATVDQVNSLVRGIQEWNAQLNADGQRDPTAEAQVYAGIESLSKLVPISVQKTPNGGLTILMNGEVPLLQGLQQFPLSVSYGAPATNAAFPDAAAQIHILDSTGTDISSSIRSGELGGLLDYSNRFLPTLLGSGDQQGDLNRLAQGIADSVNSALGGASSLFQYNGSPTDVARSLEVNPSYMAADLGAAITGNPDVANGLSNIVAGANQIDGQSYSQFLVALSSRSSADLNHASNGLDLQTKLLAQAQTFRENVQGASVEQAAVELLQYQRAFEAAAKVIGVIDQLTQTALNIVS